MKQTTSLKEEFIEPPFSVLDTRRQEWKERRRKWLDLGIVGENNRDVGVSYENGNVIFNTSYQTIFDPALCEIMYHWYCPEGGSILDPFCGAMVRGFVAKKMGYHYTGIDIRQDLIEDNISNTESLLSELPDWRCGDSRIMLCGIDDESYDMVFTCPPYANLEIYSDIEGDISHLSYPKFKQAYSDILYQSCAKVKKGGYVVLVVGEVRDPHGNLLGLVSDTVKILKKIGSGVRFYNDAVFIMSSPVAHLRARRCFGTAKLVKTHQNILIFRKEYKTTLA